MLNKALKIVFAKCVDLVLLPVKVIRKSEAQKIKFRSKSSLNKEKTFSAFFCLRKTIVKPCYSGFTYGHLSHDTLENMLNSIMHQKEIYVRKKLPRRAYICVEQFINTSVLRNFGVAKNIIPDTFIQICFKLLCFLDKRFRQHLLLLI